MAKQLLTPIEKDILKLIAQEYSGNEIAKQLNLSISEVDDHRKSIMQKTGAKSTTSLIKIAIQEKLLADYMFFHLN